MGRTQDAYSQQSHGCQSRVEIPAASVDRSGGPSCPRCVAWLLSEWLTARAEAIYSRGHARQLELLANEAAAWRGREPEAAA